jgi:tetratricopeptide (TPR) repeat protein
MKKNSVVYIALFCINSSLFAQINIFKQTNKVLKDSIEKKYFINGAERHGYTSHKWQIYLDSAIAITPDNASLWQRKAMPYFKARKYEVGMQYLDNAVLLDASEWLGYRAFIKCIFCKNYTAALTDYAAAEKLKGNFNMMEHPYSFYQGLCYLGLNKFDSALTYFNKTNEVERKTIGGSGGHFMNWFYIGIVLYEKEDFENAVMAFDKALQQYTNFSDAQYYKAICLGNQKKYDEAKVLFTLAKENAKKGYSFTEDNCAYEKYPYQLNAYMVK